MRISKLGETFFFFPKHCLTDIGQLFLSALLNSLCIVINFERAVMQDDESLKPCDQALKRQGHVFEMLMKKKKNQVQIWCVMYTDNISWICFIPLLYTNRCTTHHFNSNTLLTLEIWPGPSLLMLSALSFIPATHLSLMTDKYIHNAKKIHLVTG